MLICRGVSGNEFLDYAELGWYVNCHLPKDMYLTHLEVKFLNYLN